MNKTEWLRLDSAQKNVPKGSTMRYRTKWPERFTCSGFGHYAVCEEASAVFKLST